MTTQRKTAEELNSLEQKITEIMGGGIFEIVRHDARTVYINGNNPAADRMEEIIAELMQYEYLDAAGTDGRSGNDCINEFEKLTNPGAAFMLLDIWKDERERRLKTGAEIKAAEWTEGHETPEDLQGMNTYFYGRFGQKRERQQAAVRGRKLTGNTALTNS